MACPPREMLVSHKEERGTRTCFDTDEPQKYHAGKRSQAQKEGHLFV